MFQRFTQQQIDILDDEFSRKYWLYNPVSSAVEEWESSKGGLRAVEVWSEVLDLERRLPSHFRMDRYIASERTQLLKKYESFSEWDGKEYKPAGKVRTEEEIERSVMCILLTFDMRLGQYYDNLVNPYQPIIDRIKTIAVNSRFPEMVWNLTNALYDEEDIEESMGSKAPEEDVLAPYKKILLPPELKKIHEQMLPMVQYYHKILADNVSIGPQFNYQTFAAIWNDILYSPDILRQLTLTSSRVPNTLGKHDPNAPEFAKSGRYNLKLIMNIIGIMLEKEVLLGSIEDIRKFFFDDAKDEHFKSSRYANFERKVSGLKDKEMLGVIYSMIENYRKK